MSTPPITIERFKELAHRTASRYSHRSEPGKVAYTFLPHTLEEFHAHVCAALEASRAAVPAGMVLAPIELLKRAESSLGSFCSDHGWGDADMQTMDDLSGLLAAAPQPVAQPGEPIVYTPGEWFDATTVDLMQAFYESRLPAIREAAKEHGYAIGLHGSMRRDLDLIAAPWRDGAADADTLAHAVAMAACGITRAGAYEWEQKPAGRVATCIPICWTHRHGVLSDGHIDLSVAPVTQAKPEQAAQPFLNCTCFNETDRMYCTSKGKCSRIVAAAVPQPKD